MTTYEDYKYVMQDTGCLYLGAKYTYDELIANEDVPFKLKAVLQRYFLTEIGGGTTLEDHFFSMKPEGFVYEACKQLKIKVKYSVMEERRTLFGKTESRYRTHMVKLEKFVAAAPEEKEKMGILIQEIGMSKLALMTFSV